MLAKTYSVSLLGLSARKIEIEVDSKRGIPKLIIVGLPNKTVAECRERILSALKNCGVRLKSKRIIVNLAPADLPKTGSGLELAITVCLLKLYQKINYDTEKFIFLGEVALDGKIRRIKNAYALVDAAQKLGFTKVVLPASNKLDIFEDLNVNLYFVNHIWEVIKLRQKIDHPEILKPEKNEDDQKQNQDLFYIVGQEQAKRAIEIAAAGGHHLLMIGPAGCGKSLLAKSACLLWPKLDPVAQRVVNTIYSSRSIFRKQRELVPFRSPHHSIGVTALIGGGRPLQVGEISLAHHGILFLDEFSLISKQSRQALRQPLEEKQIEISNLVSSSVVPCDFTLIAATNPCGCGNLGHPIKKCICSVHSQQLHLKKLSGPLIDRIDLIVWMDPVNVAKLIPKNLKNNFKQTLNTQAIVQARRMQQNRYAPKNILNSSVFHGEIFQTFQPTPASIALLEQASVSFGLSARGFHKALRVARTIADLDNSEKIQTHHVGEALSFRYENLVEKK